MLADQPRRGRQRCHLCLPVTCPARSAAPRPAATATGVSATQVRLTGAGSTFDNPFFTRAFAAYQQSHPGVTISYASVGSSAGITRFAVGQVEFGATDVPASAADLAGARGGQAIQVPVDLGAVTVAYNVPRLNGAQLRLTDGNPGVAAAIDHILISARQPSTAAGQALTSLISWLTRDGQSYAAALGYVSLPPAIQRLAAATLATVTGPGGGPLTG